MPTSRRCYYRTRSGAFRRGWTECFVSSAEPPGSPLTALQAPGRDTYPHHSGPPWYAFPAALWPIPGGRMRVGAVRSRPAPFPSALCSTLAGGRESMGRDALRPDATRRLRRAAEGKGGAAWRRDRTRAQPRAAAAWRRAWRARGGPTSCPQRAPWHPCCEGQRELSTAEKFNYFLSSI